MRGRAVSGDAPRFPIPKLGNDLFLRAVNHLPVPRVPVWLMRQAGRADPEYRSYRERVGLPLRELFRRAEHAVPISLLPRRFGVDAIVLYQDILTPLAPMGADFDFRPGPILATPIRRADQVRALRPIDPAEELGFVAESIRGVLSALGGELPLIGFAGAPFTLAAFLIRGSSPMHDMHDVLAFAQEQPALFAELIDRLTEMTAAYLRFQIEAGVHAVQLFESVGDQIPAPEYARYAHPSHQRIFAALPARVPAILFVKGSPRVDLMLESGAAVLSVGERESLGDVLRRGGGRVAVQGNVDNRILVKGSGSDVEAAVVACVADSGGRGHILNLNHGLLPEAPFENVKRFVNAARKIRLEQAPRSGGPQAEAH
jgi:uroporphyrinogen decarboxylase